MKINKPFRSLALVIAIVSISGFSYANQGKNDSSCVCTDKGMVIDASGTDGCGYIIQLDNGIVLDPVVIKQNIVLYDSMRVCVGYKTDTTLLTTCMIGQPAEILCVNDISKTPVCDANFKYYKVDCEPYNSQGDTIDCSPYRYHFISNSNGKSLAFMWSVNGDTVGTGMELYYDFQKAGIYSVCLEVTGDGCSDYQCKEVVLDTNDDCQASFTYYPVSVFDTDYYASVLPPTATQYQFNGYVSGGQAAEWHWTVDDSLFSNEQFATYTFPYFGTYEVCLTTITASGCQSTVCKTITVDTIGCKANFTAWPMIYFDKMTVGPDSSNYLIYGYWFENKSYSTSEYVDWYWDFGDGTTSTEQFPEHFFPGYGNYNVCLTMTADSNSCSDTYCSVVSIDSVGECNAYFKYCTYNSVNDSVFPVEPGDSNIYFNPPYYIGFKNLSTPDNSSFYWDFGDGTGSSQKNPVHKYSSPGTYSVCLYVYANYFCESSYCESINVGGQPCEVDFAVDELVPDCSGYQIAYMFTPKSNRQVSWYNWSFGDGEYSWEDQPIHVYSNYGQYEVCVDAYTIDGCHATNCHSVYVGQDSIDKAFMKQCGVSPIHNLVMDEKLSVEDVYPVPAADNLEMNITSNHARSVTIVITDMLGRSSVLKANYELGEGENHINLDIGQFSPGTYVYTVSSAEALIRGSFSILK